MYRNYKIYRRACPCRRNEIGVELDEAVGRNNGTVREHEYFKCEENKGVLCAPHKVSLVDNETL